MGEELPDFKGRLTPTSWSGVKLTMQLELSLSLLALKTCAGCDGKGWHGERPVVQVCHCAIRRQGQQI